VNNDFASSTLGSVAAGGNGRRQPYITGALAVVDGLDAGRGVLRLRAFRSNLLSQYNNILAQITTTGAGCFVPPVSTCLVATR